MCAHAKYSHKPIQKFSNATLHCQKQRFIANAIV